MACKQKQHELMDALEMVQDGNNSELMKMSQLMLVMFTLMTMTETKLIL